MQLGLENAIAYARERGLIGAHEQPRVESLSGGVACVVLRLHAIAGSLVIKQAEEKFRVREEWIVDRSRNRLEAEFQQRARQALGPAHVPAVLDVDPDNFCYTMASAPLDAQNWKSMMMAGDVRPALGRQCGELLAKLHQMAPASFLRDKALFYQQRIEPYFEFTAKRNADVAGELRQLADRLMQAEDGVTHGDFTPKNFLVAGNDLILLDYEVGHIGWPAFDVASLVNHLTLKMVHLPAQRPALRATADRFLERHKLNLPLLGALLLARVDGKSPAEYLHEEDKPRVRAAAKDLLCGRFASYEEFQAGALS